MLAAALWSLDRMVDARAAAQSAIELLERTAEAGELARAHCALLRIEAVAFEPSAVIAAAPRTLELAAMAGLEEARIDTEITLGLAYGHAGRSEAATVLAGALADARAAGLHVQTIRAYVNSVMVAADARDHATVDAVSAAAIMLFDDYQAAIPRDAVEIAAARSLLDRGRWEEALERAARGRREWFGEVPIALVIEALVRARRGEQGADALLEQALAGVAGLPDGWRHAMLHAAIAEIAWLRGDRHALLSQVEAVRDAWWFAEFGRPSGELALWAARCGERLDPPPTAPEPVLRELAGDWRSAVHAWRELSAPYEAALAALPGDDRAARGAVATLHRLGARAAARAFARARSRARQPRPTRTAARNTGQRRRTDPTRAGGARPRRLGRDQPADRSGAAFVRANGRASRLRDPVKARTSPLGPPRSRPPTPPGCSQEIGRRCRRYRQADRCLLRVVTVASGATQIPLEEAR